MAVWREEVRTQTSYRGARPQQAVYFVDVIQLPLAFLRQVVQSEDRQPQLFLVGERAPDSIDLVESVHPGVCAVGDGRAIVSSSSCCCCCAVALISLSCSHLRCRYLCARAEEETSSGLQKLVEVQSGRCRQHLAAQAQDAISVFRDSSTDLGHVVDVELFDVSLRESASLAVQLTFPPVFVVRRIDQGDNIASYEGQVFFLISLERKGRDRILFLCLESLDREADFGFPHFRHHVQVVCKRFQMRARVQDLVVQGLQNLDKELGSNQLRQCGQLLDIGFGEGSFVSMHVPPSPPRLLLIARQKSDHLAKPKVQVLAVGFSKVLVLTFGELHRVVLSDRVQLLGCCFAHWRDDISVRCFLQQPGVRVVEIGFQGVNEVLRNLKVVFDHHFYVTLWEHPFFPEQAALPPRAIFESMKNLNNISSCETKVIRVVRRVIVKSLGILSF
mmetsp:Transcript_3355/g.6322  ORF Transcript_3355/g.6322 Transcript_3355/m.6322 type:complete len:445 (-) Transcript_3355:1947-3281(-)